VPCHSICDFDLFSMCLSASNLASGQPKPAPRTSRLPLLTVRVAIGAAGKKTPVRTEATRRARIALARIL
jgi:hypothetical protein